MTEPTQPPRDYIAIIQRYRITPSGRAVLDKERMKHAEQTTVRAIFRDMHQATGAAGYYDVTIYPAQGGAAVAIGTSLYDCIAARDAIDQPTQRTRRGIRRG